ncbi:MAG: hypothetical protein QGG36_05385 [Pirellulaceae bacterium]|jgi:WD40 repeat protein|nr:hypothetical protein [Pirellulaceae bacterium]MDP7015207.1 hypothetical protein [Pirellulaceae bacterium]
MKIDVTKAWSEKKLQHERQLVACQFSPCGEFVVAAGMDSSLHRWTLATDEHAPLAGHATWIGDVAFHPDKSRVYSVDYRGGLFCWDYRTAKLLWKKESAHDGWARKVAVSPNGKFVATGGNDRVLRVWSDGGELVGEWPGHDGYIFSIAFHPDSKTVVSGDQVGVARQWELPGGKEVRQFDLSVLHTRKDNFLAHVGGVRSMAFDATGSTLACGGMTNAKSNSFCPGDPLVVLLDAATGESKTQLKPSQKADGPINSLRFLPTGQLAGVGEGASGASLAFWKLDQQTPIHTIKMGSGYEVDLHPDELRLLVCRFEANGRGGNGRHATPETYISNDGVIEIYNLYEKPAQT